MAAKVELSRPDLTLAEEDVAVTASDDGTLPPKRSREESRVGSGECTPDTANIADEPEEENLPPLVIDTVPADIPDIPPPEAIVTGRRIIDVAHFFKEIKRLEAHTGRCTYGRMELAREIRCGLHSTFVHRCVSCGVQANVTTCPNKGVNDDAVLGAMAAGITRTQLGDLMRVLEVPMMSKQKFEKCLKKNKSVIG